MALGSVYAESQKDSLDEFTKATQLRPKSEAAWESRAWMHSSLKQYDELNPKAWNWLYPGLVSCYDRFLKEKDLN